MTLIRPFKGWVASSAHCNQIPIKHIDSYSSVVIKKELETNRYSFLQVLAPSIQTNHELDLKERFALVRERLIEQLFSGIYQQINTDSLWVYKVHSSTVQALGVVGVSPISAYTKKIIKPHEYTSTSRRDTLATYLDEVGIHADPVVIGLSENKEEFKSWCNHFISLKSPDICVSFEKEEHQLWQLVDSEQITAIQQIIESNSTAYIVDGHHRIESSLHYAKNKKDVEKALENGHFMSFFLTEDDLSIRSFSKHYSTSINEEACLAAVKPIVFYEKCEAKPLNEEHLLLIDQNAYLIRYRENKQLADLDKCLRELPKETSKSLSQTTIQIRPKDSTIEDLKRAAETMNPMAEKSTYIEPKLLTGLLIYPIS